VGRIIPLASNLQCRLRFPFPRPSLIFFFSCVVFAFVQFPPAQIGVLCHPPWERPAGNAFSWGALYRHPAFSVGPKFHSPLVTRVFALCSDQLDEPGPPTTFVIACSHLSLTFFHLPILNVFLVPTWVCLLRFFLPDLLPPPPPAAPPLCYFRPPGGDSFLMPGMNLGPRLIVGTALYFVFLAQRFQSLPFSTGFRNTPSFDIFPRRFFYIAVSPDSPLEVPLDRWMFPTFFGFSLPRAVQAP